MKTYQRSLITLLCFGSLVAVAIAMIQQAPKTAHAIDAADARALSSVFRGVSKKVMPSVVTITTKGKAVELSGDVQNPFGEDSPFGDLFKDHPQFRDMFRNGKRFRMPPSSGKGSGFVVDSSGIIVTNSHVVENAAEIVVRLHDGREFEGRDVKVDPRSDLAIVRIDAPKDLQAVELGDSDAMEIGDWVLAVGSPFGYDLTVTAGIISAKGRVPGINVSEDYLQTDAAINPGNSGGPLLNLNGQVVGVNTAISSRSGGYDGVGFAIPVNMVRWISEQLIERGTVSRAFLGVGIQGIDKAIAEKLSVPSGRGALVNRVMEGSAADDAKLKAGDVIVELDGRPVAGPKQLQRIVEQLKIDKSYSLKVVRDSEPLELKITMREMPEEIANVGRGKPGLEPETEEKEEAVEELGIEIQELTPELAKQFKLETTSGVLIRSVAPDSEANAQGIRPGHVILQVNQKPVNSPEEFKKIVDEIDLNEGVLLLIQTPQGSRFVVLK